MLAQLSVSPSAHFFLAVNPFITLAFEGSSLCYWCPSRSGEQLGGLFFGGKVRAGHEPSDVPAAPYAAVPWPGKGALALCYQNILLGGSVAVASVA